MKKLILLPVFLFLTQHVQALQNDYNYARKYCELITDISGAAATFRMNDADQEEVVQYFKEIDDQNIGIDMIKQLVTEAYALPIEYDESLQPQVINQFIEKKRNSCMEQTYLVEQERTK